MDIEQFAQTEKSLLLNNIESTVKNINSLISQVDDLDYQYRKDCKNIDKTELDVEEKCYQKQCIWDQYYDERVYLIETEINSKKDCLKNYNFMLDIINYYLEQYDI